MSVPAKKRSRSEVRRGRSHQALKKVKLNKCPKCGKAVLPHTACKFCGSYKGREVLKIKSKVKKEKK
ncbi:50S ribosomal protein L32 [Patescibacteria group bacterium]|nr:50S ribosomal protein L32 [Patescibacteria group bacterium]MBU1933954.1 50S ribosomal protein L32 [Patescibacteria group bacterium]MBU2007516.1 50S ribosomal protein L32 [Patescibacteria group bacterium]MBU2264291.1 50S ribosomal protein L32 [Patescibacteria group bacterium]